MRNLISAKQFTRKSLERLFLLTQQIKADPAAYRRRLEGKVVALMFFEPSTRTRMSFDAACLRLGASVIATENGCDHSSAKKGESIADTVRMLGAYADAIVIRHPADDSAEQAAQAAKVPFINAGSGKSEHPTQALLDLYTLWEEFGTLDGLSLAVIGDLKHGRTVHSLLEALALFDGVRAYGLSNPALALPAEYQQGLTYQAVASFAELPKDLQALYATRVQRERIAGDAGATGHIIDATVLVHFSPQTIVLHPLPRNEEIAVAVDDDPRARYFTQAANGMYVRMALLLELLG